MPDAEVFIDNKPVRLKECRERLKAEARQNGKDWRQWTQDAVSKKMDVDLSTYQRWESGSRAPDIGQIKKLASVFGIPLYELLGEVPMVQSDNILVQFISEMKVEIDRLTREIEGLRAENKVIKADKSRIKYRSMPEGQDDGGMAHSSDDAASKRR